MEITETLRCHSRSGWREWLDSNHRIAKEIWLIAQAELNYLQTVEEALCFGWIDGIAKRLPHGETAQRFTPRRARSNWTELNKARARRLIELGLMTEAGLQTLPDLGAPFVVPADVIEAINVTPNARAHFDSFPELYVRVRVGYITEVRKMPLEFNRRLKSFLEKTVAGKMFGNWNDGGLLR
jgi:uncharacterized protein YdeI (YjbR/CyaY-like superfamily)